MNLGGALGPRMWSKIQLMFCLRQIKNVKGVCNVIALTLHVSSLLGRCGRMKAALLSGPLHESAACVKSKQLVRTTK